MLWLQNSFMMFRHRLFTIYRFHVTKIGEPSSLFVVCCCLFSTDALPILLESTRRTWQNKSNLPWQCNLAPIQCTALQFVVSCCYTSSSHTRIYIRHIYIYTLLCTSIWWTSFSKGTTNSSFGMIFRQKFICPSSQANYKAVGLLDYVTLTHCYTCAHKELTNECTSQKSNFGFSRVFKQKRRSSQSNLQFWKIRICWPSNEWLRLISAKISWSWHTCSKIHHPTSVQSNSATA